MILTGNFGILSKNYTDLKYKNRNTFNYINLKYGKIILRGYFENKTHYK